MNRKKTKSLQRKLTSRVILIALVILITAVISSQISSNASFWKATEESVALSTLIEAGKINNIINEAATLLKVTANDMKFLSYDDMRVIQNYLKNARAPYSYVSEMYIGIAETNQYMDGAGYVPSADWVLTQRPYYIGAMNTDGIFYQDPYLASTGEIFSSIAVKLEDESGDVIGAAVLDLALETLLELCNNSSIPGTAAAGFLLDGKKQILAHSNTAFMPYVSGEEAVFKQYDSIGVQKAETITERPEDELALVKAVDYDGAEKYICTVVLPGSGWTFGFAVPVNDFAANLNTASAIAAYAAIIAAAIILIFFASQFLLIRPIKPIGDIINTAKMLAAGKTPLPLSIDADDELGVLAEDFNKFIMSTQEQVSALAKMADGDFTSKVTPKSQDDLLSNAINRVTENIQKLVDSIDDASLHVAASAAQISQGSQSLSDNAVEQSELISGTIMANAEKGGRQMKEMTEAVRDINLASQNISDIMVSINNIARQTNILSLNASVEAVRSGEYGKSFGAVAEEVRNLAVKSAEAAKKTESLIENSINKAVLGSNIAGEAAASFEKIISGINRVAQVVEHNSVIAREESAASGKMNGQSEMLRQLIARFKLRTE